MRYLPISDFIKASRRAERLSLRNCRYSADGLTFQQVIKDSGFGRKIVEQLCDY
jgi:hypothetical protein